MIKLVLFSSVVLVAVSIAAVVTGITSVQQVLLLALVVVFFAVFVKGVVEGVRISTGYRRDPARGT